MADATQGTTARLNRLIDFGRLGRLHSLPKNSSHGSFDGSSFGGIWRKYIEIPIQRFVAISANIVATFL